MPRVSPHSHRVWTPPQCCCIPSSGWRSRFLGGVHLHLGLPWAHLESSAFANAGSFSKTPLPSVGGLHCEVHLRDTLANLAANATASGVSTLPRGRPQDWPSPRLVPWVQSLSSTCCPLCQTTLQYGVLLPPFYKEKITCTEVQPQSSHRRQGRPDPSVFYSKPRCLWRKGSGLCCSCQAWSLTPRRALQ